MPILTMISEAISEHIQLDGCVPASDYAWKDIPSERRVGAHIGRTVGRDSDMGFVNPNFFQRHVKI